ncbi:protein kinase domain-containing protein [Pectobacterium parmentieri]|uniref:Protein kinase n=1 Tax=Pectobacterium parmentieri TaxID=1905730 RepID=A0ABS0RYJ1_PECPM|nr:protein kinase [Pectobacterium parmentieri]MBI0471276.1 protein kinase [Pectobacterium parmentieri]MBI0493888.1 protein kinase [Pectobacterium parmentieri]MBI0554690.1 protein kinase [Pectobacterium parmentieri]MBI0568154.1 protein kinase [Pectobacterium parmentieri]MBI0573123.1 protein kinase [Pectobacterium parmentieri]
MTSTKMQSKRVVYDTRGSAYELTQEISRGGQGVVYRTSLPQTLVKGFINQDPLARQQWRSHIAWLLRQDLSELKLARPLVLLAEPRCGYVMELMDGLVPLGSLLDSFIEAGESSLEDYLRQGGLRRRIRILCQMARTLNQLHARGMLYGDLSPSNIFVSDDPIHAETWLIDCDNISFTSQCQMTLHTVDYGAPEVVKGEALLSSLTDIWSFAVIAWQLLTHNHPFKGELVSNGSPEMEEAAMRGEYPWINDSQDEANNCFVNLPPALIANSELPALFARCFEQGRFDPCDRPGMAEWLEALTAVDERFFTCGNCGGSTLLAVDTQSAKDAACFYCDSPADPLLIRFSEYIIQPQDDANPDGASLIATGRSVWLQPGGGIELKRLLPSFSYDRRPMDHLRIDYDARGLGIHPLPGGQLYLQRGEKTKPLTRYQGLKNEVRGQFELPWLIHIGDPDQPHVVWQFRW